MIFLTFLHIAWFSQNDLKRLFLRKQNYKEIYDLIRAGKDINMPWIKQEKYTKIQKNTLKIDTKKIEKIIQDKKIEIITIENSKYPEKLRTIKQAPYILYVRWKFYEKPVMLGVVWPRRNTHYGKKVLDTILPDLVNMDCGIVSGWAYGIDAISHDITLQHQWYTISVFGCGVDICYPQSNSLLFEKILDNGGALVSIFPIGSHAEPWRFPVRNEIIAALSDGIIIPEAGIKSGTLITARLALEHWRDVFVVPWDIFREASHGANMLLANGEAKGVLQTNDILEEYFTHSPEKSAQIICKKVFDTQEQSELYQAIEQWYNTPDSICEQTGYDLSTIIMTLSILEMSGHIRMGAAGVYETI